MTVSIRDVAAHAGVSLGTVSNVLNRPDVVADGTVERVRAAVAELGYVRNDAARQLRAGRSLTVGLVVLDSANPFYAELSRGAEDEASRHGLSVLVGNSGEQEEREATYLDLFAQQRVWGVLVSPVGQNVDHLIRLSERGIPVVLVDRSAPGSGLSSVATDDVRGGYLAVKHLLDQGRRRIAYISGPQVLHQVADRLEGARRAVDEVQGATLEVIERAALTVLEGRAAAQIIVERPSGGRPDAIFAANDLLATGALQAIVMGGSLRVPDDIALIGYDDIDFASSAVVPFSSIRQPARLMGETAMQLLADRPDPPQDIRFTPELIVRDSTSP
ncbi:MULTISPECIES: LacI family DNA-binding transcriptional regulator [unclassified Microbacterium]|uniref:LacI family DNA-binding transcriptional regulator n=1 Tax=unclassified Microbacterium TaxID=2609290 RepID=UPI00097F23EE|nr:LacI family DNA-binding transcriptional regulator [Microbacterium sp. JB110]RCS58792.1 LacI family transcriptional regulator [Microbacterium sp. JB110]SJM54508.1 Transcriptional regulator of rhamnose utilization, LacI family [Frigoribacterium sp. JB110]